jgi:dihydrolipoamide dehydrogenase
MADNSNFDLVIIGGGPAGYVGAIRAAQLGLKVACVEREALGGVCLNWGCIPTKALLAGAEFYHALKHDAESWGINAQGVSHDWSKVIGRSRQVAGNLNKGVHALFKKNKITHIQGHAKIVGTKPVKLEIHDQPGHVAQTIEAKHVMIATGAVPRSLPGADFDGDKIIAAREAMSLAEQPKKLIVVGAGAIGMEFAYFYKAFGTEVTVIEMMDRLMPIEDHDVSKEIARAFRKLGIETRTGTKTLKIEKTAEGVSVTVAPVSDEKKTETLTGDKVLVAIGVRGRYDGLFDESLGLEIERDHIKVDRSTYQTNLPGVYATGDVIGPPWLAHVASEEAIACVEQIAGHKATPVHYGQVPGCTYCQPQVASVGLTEQACKDKGIDYKVGKFPFTASGKAQAMGETTGFVKIISDPKYGEILGVHMIGEGVTELIAEMGLAMRLEATVDEVITTMHAHPTLSEAVHEAALDAGDRMIHF